MEINNIKCVMIFDESLPVGVIANTAAIIGASLGKADPDVVGITGYGWKRTFRSYPVPCSYIKV